MEELEKGEISVEIIDGTQTIIADGVFAIQPKLTPTGKISHAKTRVYTQRYRKEWEQMPDFRGWLTSVASQPTRAFCVYCKKNLHAHRLSLLKHTCTMKHQRAALLAQTDSGKRILDSEDPDKSSETEPTFEEVTVVGSLKHLANEADEDNDEYEYVVESLEVEEDEEEIDEMNDQPNQEEEADNSSLKLMSGDEESSAKKIKLEHYPRRDTLAEAMAHVHQDYLDQNEDQETVGLDMEVESETTILPDKDEEEVCSDEGDEKTKMRRLKQVEDTPGVKTAHKPKILAYKINSSELAGINLQASNTVTISTSNNKTVTLNAAKAVTLNASQLPGGGAQFVLSKVKGNLPALVMAGSKTANSRPLAPKSGSKNVSVSNSGVTGASSSGQVEQEIQKPQETHKQSEGLKNPCISTHVMDTSRGTPITGLQVSLYKLMDGRWTFLNESTTSVSGRCIDLVNTGKTAFTAGRYKMHFDVDKYFTLRKIETLYPFIEIVFDVKNPTVNYHIPVLLSPYGYTTYRGTDR